MFPHTPIHSHNDLNQDTDQSSDQNSRLPKPSLRALPTRRIRV
jgi:hypothetical protein